jgi:RimJ/RimL family protein N-acetyltransferase
MSGVKIRPSSATDLEFITGLERDAENRDFIGQWSDGEHLSAIAGENRREHWIIEHDGQRAGYLIANDCRDSNAGFHVKRLLVEEKNRGIGREALGQFSTHALALEGANCVWLNVRDWNARAQRVYSKLGYVRFDPGPEEAARYDAAAEAPGHGAFRMRLAKAAA